MDVGRVFDNLIPHSPIAPLAFVPHPGELRLVRFDVIENSNILLPVMLPMQTTCILLQRSFPGYRHGQHQGIQRRVVKPFTDQPAGRQQADV